ncbi:hypothetical protein FACS189451_03860 [Bacteroidia bacterium]|nr:hypothetical protein FACS189446_1660 [Bacteroidia bacterium]GHT61566.1 hypothetical protein FACS189451_03860 [Bacteroidia bacterium]
MMTLWTLVYLGIIGLLIYLIIRTIIRWVKKIHFLWKTDQKKSVVWIGVKGIVIVTVIAMGIYYIKYIAIVCIAIVMGAMKLLEGKSNNPYERYPYDLDFWKH